MATEQVSNPSCESADRAPATDRWDVVVIGAGPSGSVAANVLARGGRKVLLVDRASMPRPKVCGCCLSPSGVRVLQEIGVGQVLRGAATVTHCAIHAGRGSARVAARGYQVIGRDVLDTRLASAAESAGATLMLNRSARVDAEGSVRLQWTGRGDSGAAAANETGPVRLTPRALVIADGLGGTSLSDRPEFEWRVSEGSRMGMGATLSRPPVVMAEGEIAMLCGRDGYLGFVRLPTGEIDAAAALDSAAVREAGGPAALCMRIVAGCGGDGDALHGAAWRGTPLLTRRRACVEAGNVFVLGDAAGYVEPFTGEGMGWAMEGAAAAARFVGNWLDGRAGAGEWAAAYRERMRSQHRRCAIVAKMVRHEWLMRTAVGCAGRWPSIGRWASRVLGPAESNAGEGAPA